MGLYLAVHVLALSVIGVFFVCKGTKDAHAGHPPGDMPTIAGHDSAHETQWVSGLAHFDGIAEGFDVPAEPAADWGPAQSFSIECWLKTDARITRKPSQVVIGRDEWARRTGSGMHWWVGLWGKDPKSLGLTGKAAFVLRDKQGHSISVAGKQRLDDRRWHHLAAVRDAASGRVILYVDGKQEASAPAAFATGFDSTLSPLNVGWLNHAMHGGTNRFYRFRGTIDKVSIHNYAVTP